MRELDLTTSLRGSEVPTRQGENTAFSEVTSYRFGHRFVSFIANRSLPVMALSSN